MNPQFLDYTSRRIKNVVLKSFESCLCSIEAITEVTVFSMTIPYFQSLIKSNINLTQLLLDVFAERIVNTSNESSYQQLHATEHTFGTKGERNEDFKRRYGSLFGNYSQKSE
ncbi:hypothetical protein [Chryseobacterium sp. 3008163]|uniref:hypothetical protein n=1 Tax=Chryseobacterium sp. 3008163 TaxID=2478663 RepID=UPI000F0D1891|nr:hypothetical protein [Chryseobacterium sp. 3008163]AYN02422.1 hypothetical protein EAG08_20810 [Chryseobacterium sp. 3008163]